MLLVYWSYGVGLDFQGSGMGRTMVWAWGVRGDEGGHHLLRALIGSQGLVSDKAIYLDGLPIVCCGCM